MQEEQVVETITEAQEKKIITDCGTLGVFFGRLDEISSSGNSTRQTIGQVLEVVDDTFYLVPKLELKDDDVVERELPDNALEDTLSSYWTEVNS